MTQLTLTELAARTGVTPRTVRYYIAQGLLPPPVDQGRSAHYGDGHVARIRLIKRLQREHLPLAEIRTRLHALDDREVRHALEATASPHDAPDPGSALEYVRRVLDSRSETSRAPSRLLRAAQVGPSSAGSRVGEAGSWPAPQRGIAPDAGTRSVFHREVPDGFPVPGDPASPVRDSDLTPSMPHAFPSPGPRPGERSTWERIAVTPDIEVHVRRPLDRQGNRMLDRLLAYARELLQDR